MFGLGAVDIFSFFIHSCFNYLIKHVYVTFILERHYKPFIKSYWFVSVGSLPIELISHTLEGLRKKMDLELERWFGNYQ